MSFKQIFQYGRVAAIVGNRHQGKTNNILSMVHELRQEEKKNKTKPINVYAFGLPASLEPTLKKLKINIIDQVRQLASCKNSIIILDEFQKLKLNDRRHKDILIELMAMIYHPESNNYVLFCSPTIREYNSIIGGFIEVWLLKSLYIDDLINGSQIKKACQNYKGKYYKLGYFDIPPSDMVLLNDTQEEVIKCKYLEIADNKKNIKSLF